MHIHPFQALLPNLDKIQHPDDFFARCKAEYRFYLQQDYFQLQPQQALYYYEIEHPKRTFRGILAEVAMQDYLSGHIKKHEHTIPGKEAIQQALFQEQRALVKPILTTYPTTPLIRNWMDRISLHTRPILEIRQESEPFIHRLYPVYDQPSIQAIQHVFQEEVADVFIADGHHRCAAAATLYQQHQERPFERLLCAFFDSEALTIHSFNRVVDLQDVPPLHFLNALRTYCEVSPCITPSVPNKAHEMLLFLDHSWYSLYWKPALIEQRGGFNHILDVQLLNDLIFGDLLGIREVSREPRITYLEGPAGLEELRHKTNKKSVQAAFCLHPISVSDFMEFAAQRVIFPPKSTWFEPRMKSGLIVAPWTPINS